MTFYLNHKLRTEQNTEVLNFEKETQVLLSGNQYIQNLDNLILNMISIIFLFVKYLFLNINKLQAFDNL